MNGFESNPLYKNVQDYLVKSHTPQQNQPTPNKPIKTVLLVIIPIILILGVVSVLLIFNPLNLPLLSKNPPAGNVNSQPKETVTFSGTILEIKPHEDQEGSLRLITDIIGAPELIINKRTELRFREEGEKVLKTFPATLDDLKVGQKIKIRLIEQPDTGKLRITGVNILR